MPVLGRWGKYPNLTMIYNDANAGTEKGGEEVE